MENRLSIPCQGDTRSYRDRMADRIQMISSAQWCYNVFHDLMKTHCFVDMICRLFYEHISTIPTSELSGIAIDRRKDWRDSLCFFSKKAFFALSDKASEVLDEAKDDLESFISNQQEILRLQYYSLYRGHVEESHLQATATCLLAFRYSYLAQVHFERAKGRHNQDLEKIQNSIKSFVSQYNGADFFNIELDEKTYKATEGLEFSLGKKIQEWFNLNGESIRLKISKL